MFRSSNFHNFLWVTLQKLNEINHKGYIHYFLNRVAKQSNNQAPRLTLTDANFAVVSDEYE